MGKDNEAMKKYATNLPFQNWKHNLSYGQEGGGTFKFERRFQKKEPISSNHPKHRETRHSQYSESPI